MSKASTLNLFRWMSSKSPSLEVTGFWVGNNQKNKIDMSRDFFQISLIKIVFIGKMRNRIHFQTSLQNPKSKSQ